MMIATEVSESLMVDLPEVSLTCWEMILLSVALSIGLGGAVWCCAKRCVQQRKERRRSEIWRIIDNWELGNQELGIGYEETVLFLQSAIL